MNALPIKANECIPTEEIVSFLFSQSQYKFEDPNKEINQPTIKYWIANVARGTFLLKTTFKAFHGKRILSRQISNSNDLKDRVVLSVENDVEESEEEKIEFSKEVAAFAGAMEEEILISTSP